MDLPDRQLLDAAPDAMVVVDASGMIVLVNRQTESLFGYQRDALIGQPVEILLPDRFRERHPQHRSEFSSNPRVRPMGQGLRLYGQRQNGTEFPIEISLSPVESKHGTFIASAIRDATIHREMEDRLSGILEESLNEIYVFSADDLRFIQANRGARRNLGYSMEELLRLTPVDIKPDYTAKLFEEVLRPLRDNQLEKVDFETIHERKDGTTYPVEVHLQCSQFESMPVFTAIILDITERKQAEAALRDSHQLLEKRVFDRTAALEVARGEAEQARSEAERANAGKSRFLAAASHDLRQPLQSLGLYLSVMTRQFAQPKQLDRTKLSDVSTKMRKSLDTMGELLDALLDISRLDGGSIIPEKRDVRIQELLDRVVTDNVQQAQEKGLQLTCTRNDCVVHSDPGLLERVIENFVTNAIRYTESGKVSIDCRHIGGVARVAVTDTGIGIAGDALEKVFEEYYQLDNPVRDRRKGLGLGLSIAKHIARLLDHPLKVTSVPGVGSTFAIDIPLGTTEIAAVESKAAPMVSHRGDRETVVLFVDDDPAIVDATSMLLQVAGVRVFSAFSGDEALAHITAGVRPDMLVSDYRLPVYDGVEVVRRVRRAVGDDLPTVLMTGDTSLQAIESAKLTNCTVLHKPVDTDHLISLIESLGAQ